MNRLLKSIIIDNKINIIFDNGINTLIKTSGIEKSIKRLKELNKDISDKSDYSIYHSFKTNDTDIDVDIALNVRDSKYEKLMIDVTNIPIESLELVFEINKKVERINLNSIILIELLNGNYNRIQDLEKFDLGDCDNVHININKENNEIKLIINLKEEYF